LAFASGTGVLTVGRSGLSDLTVDLDGRYSTTDTQYSVATSGTAGLVKIGFTESGKNYPVQLSSDKMFVNVPWTDTSYSLPLSSSSTRGGVKIGYAENGKNYPVELSSEKMFVTVPWTDTNTDTNTTYTAGGGLTLSGTEFSLTAVTEATNVTAVSRRYLNSITLDGYGRVTGVGTASEGDQPVPNYYVNSASFNSSTGDLTLTRSDSGTVVVDLDGAYLRSITSSMVTSALGYTPPTSDTNTTYTSSDFTVTALSGYSSNNGTFLRRDGTFATPPNDNTTYSNLNEFANGPGYTTYSSNQATDTTSTVQFALIRSTGDVVAYYSSDERLKDNVKPIENALEKLQKIRGVEFDWNDKQDVYEGHDTGVIAQEVQKVLPEVVTEREDGYLAVKYEKMIGLLVESIKDLKAEVDELKTQLNRD
jgi:hypothetical protein